MSGEIASEPLHLLNQLQQRYDSIAADDSHGKKRTKAWERFVQIGLPSRKQEVFQYVPLRRLFEGTYTPPATSTLSAAHVAPHLLPECLQSHLVFVNGKFQPSLSDISGLDAKVVVSDLVAANQSFGVFLNNHWSQGLKEEIDPFAALNTALQEDGLFVYIPPKCVVEAPLQIVHLIVGQQILALPRVQIVSGKESFITLAYTTIDTGSSGYAVSGVIDFTLEDNAHVKFIQSTPDLAADGWHFNALRARLKKHANFHSVSVTKGARTVRNDYRVTLTGEGSEAALNDLWMLAEKRESHAHVLIEHQAPNCRSHQLFKGVLADISRSSFEGKIYVQRAAQKTEAYQLNNNLLLSDNANADSKPNLEIFADDVKASHGATVGQLDAEQLFYLKARGLGDFESKNLLINGFAREIVDLIRLSSLHELLLAQVRAFLT